MTSTFRIESSDTPVTLRRRLEASFTTTSPGPFSMHTTFRGETWQDGFRVTRNVAWLERAMPIVAEGELTSDRSSGKTLVTIRTRPEWVVMVILVGWSALWIAVMAVAAFWSADRGEAAWILVLLPIGMILTFWGIVFVGTTMEERRYQEALTKLLVDETQRS